MPYELVSSFQLISVGWNKTTGLFFFGFEYSLLPIKELSSEISSWWFLDYDDTGI